MLDKQSKQKIREIIVKREPVVIITHINPDGDAIGSASALALFLKEMQIPVSVIIPNEVPEFLKWLPGYELVNIFSESKDHCRTLISEASTLFFLDFNEPDRAGKLKKDILAATAFKIMIDHHQGPDAFADLMISETWRGSTGEMIYILMDELGETDKLNKEIATCLYVAIMTDTGNFRYSSSYSEIFTIAGVLVNKGVDKDLIFSNVYDSYSEDRMKLMGYCMSEKLVVLNEYNTAYISITKEELDRFNHKAGDTEGFVNIPFSIKGIIMTALFVEKKNLVKISFRSKGSFSVDGFASRYFNGGGHINAAGGETHLTLKEAIRLFESKLAEYKNELA